MSSLRQYERDRSLSERLGSGALRLPEDAQISTWVGEHLSSEDSPTVNKTELIFARWKPGTALLGSWRLSFSDGQERCINWKRYLGPKASARGAAFRLDEHMLSATAPLKAFTHLPGAGGILTCFPADRRLTGAARVLDLRRTGRALDASGIWGERVLRRQSSRMQLLRYKPEHRAVLRFHAKLKEGREGPRVSAGERTFGVRVLSPENAARVLANRERGPAGLFPELLWHEVENGILLEQWVDGDALEWNAFERASEAAGLLQGLHQPCQAARPREHSREGALELLELLPGAAKLVHRIASLGSTSCSHWIHADFHPDQLIEGEAGLRLLDADALRPGAPEEDFASWLADHLQQEPGAALGSLIKPLMEGYGHACASLDLPLIRALTTEQLIGRAAAGLRRLELGAESKAMQLLERAEQLSKEQALR